MPDLRKAKIFTTLDAKNGFWHIKLDEESSYLITFNTAYGRFCWLRMPFAITTATEEFQRRQYQIVEDLQGVKSTHDDILVFRDGKTIEEAIINHDQRLQALMERCMERSLRLNAERIKFRVTSVPFLAHLITDEGLKPDPGNRGGARGGRGGYSPSVGKP